MRRSIVVVLLVAIVAAIGWWLLHWRSGTSTPADPWRAVSPNAAVIVQVPAPLSTWQRSTSTSQFWGDLEQVPGCLALNKVMTRMAEACEGDEALRGTLDAFPLVLFCEPLGTDIGTVAAWPLGDRSEAWAPFAKALGADLGPSSPVRRGGHLTIRPDSTWPALELAWRNGLLLLGNDKGLLDDALRRVAGPATAVDSLLTRARTTFGGGSDANLLVHPARLARMLNGRLQPGTFLPEDTPEGWAALDVRLRPGAVLLSGLLYTAGGTRQLDAMGHQATGKQNIARVLPANVTWLRTMRVDDPARFTQEITGKSADDSLFQAYAAWVSGTIGVAAARTTDDTLTHAWAVLQARGPAPAVAALNTRCTGGCDTSAYRGMHIGRVMDNGVLEGLFGKAFADFARPWWVVLGDKVLFANTPADMRAAIDAWTDGTSLALDPRSGDLFRQYTSDAGFSWWTDLANAAPLWHRQLAAGTAADIDRRREAWSGTGGCLLEALAPQGPGVFEVTGCVQHAPAAQRDAGALWSASIGAPLENPPFLLEDHLSRTLQVLVQDRDHRISLISCTGKVLWQRELDGPILGDVRQVDRFRNGKLQMLFNTAARIHLIDRNGKNVEAFPIALKEQAAAPLSVFDYEGTREYRVLVPTVEGHLLNFGMDGRPVQGWAPAAFPSTLVAPVQHLRVQAKDILVAVGQRGELSVLDRRGETRYVPKLRMPGMAAFLGLRPAMEVGLCRAIWTDSSGAVISGTFDGTLDTLATGAGSAAVVMDLDGDGTDEVVRTRRDSLSVIGAKGVRSTSFLPDAPATPAFAVPLGTGGNAIGVVLAAREQVRLMRSDGTLWPGFPLKGSVPFRVADINRDGVLELVTATPEGRVVVYALPPITP